MLTLVYFLLIAGIISWLFETAAGLVLGLPVMLYTSVTKTDLDETLYRHPLMVPIIGMFNHVLVGALYGFLIFATSLYFINHNHGNYWIYFTLSILWSLVAMKGVDGLRGIFFMCCTGGLLVMWLLNIYWLLGLLIVVMLFNVVSYIIAVYQ